MLPIRPYQVIQLPPRPKGHCFLGNLSSCTRTTNPTTSSSLTTEPWQGGSSLIYSDCQQIAQHLIPGWLTFFQLSWFINSEPGTPTGLLNKQWASVNGRPDSRSSLSNVNGLEFTQAQTSNSIVLVHFVRDPTWCFLETSLSAPTSLAQYQPSWSQCRWDKVNPITPIWLSLTWANVNNNT